MLERYPSARCGDCGRGLTWIEIAFGRFNDPVCGRCLGIRQKAWEREQERLAKDQAEGNLRAHLWYED